MAKKFSDYSNQSVPDDNGKMLFENPSGDNSYNTTYLQLKNTFGTVRTVSAGNGMNFGDITITGSVVLGLPSSLTSVTANAVSTNSHTHEIVTGIANTNILRIDQSDAIATEYARLTANGIESRSVIEVRSDIGLSSTDSPTFQNVIASNRFEAQSTSQGNLPPRMTEAGILAISSPVAGETIYDTTNNVYKVYNPNNPNPAEEKYEQFAVNTEGIVKVNGYYNTQVTCTFINSTNIINATGHGLSNGNKVSFRATTGTLPPEIIPDHAYFVINALTNTFQISTTLSGPVFNFTTDGTPITIFYNLSVASIDQVLTILAGGTKYIFYPIVRKLEISSSTDWPHNATKVDNNFHNINIQSGTFTGNTTIGSAIINNMNTTTNLYAGMIITGAGIPSNSIVFSIDSATQITISNNATATATGVSFTFYKNKFLENNISYQQTTFRVRASYTKTSSSVAEVVTFFLQNPVSGFILEDTNVIRRTSTSGNLTFEVISIADSASIGEGYVFSLFSSDDITITITDITRFSSHKSRIHN